MAQSFSVSETLVLVVSLNTFEFPDGEELRLKVEIWQSANGEYSVSIWRLELMKMTPFAPPADCDTFDYTVWVEDTFLTTLCENCHGGSAADSLDKALCKINHHFCLP